MKALDSNVVIHYLLGDDLAQARKIKRRFEKAAREGERFLITNLAVLEANWVLSRVYGFSREDILYALERLMHIDAFAFEDIDFMRAFLDLGRSRELDLDDILIGLAGSAAGCEATLAFDRRAAKSDLFEML